MVQNFFRNPIINQKSSNEKLFSNIDLKKSKKSFEKSDLNTKI